MCITQTMYCKPLESLFNAIKLLALLRLNSKSYFYPNLKKLTKCDIPNRIPLKNTKKDG